MASMEDKIATSAIGNSHPTLHPNFDTSNSTDDEQEKDEPLHSHPESLNSPTDSNSAETATAKTAKVRDTSEASDSDEEDEEEVAIVLNNDPSKPKLRFTGGTNRYVRSNFNGSTPHGSVAAGQDYSEDLLIDDTLAFGGKRTAFDVDVDALEDKPWRKPGVDISDYFNYGFDERGWREYATKQLEIRRDLAIEKAKEHAARQASTAAVAHVNAERASKHAEFMSNHDDTMKISEQLAAPGTEPFPTENNHTGTDYMRGIAREGNDGPGSMPGSMPPPHGPHGGYMQPPGWHPNMGAPPPFMPNWNYNMGMPRNPSQIPHWGNHNRPPPWMHPEFPNAPSEDPDKRRQERKTLPHSDHKRNETPDVQKQNDRRDHRDNRRDSNKSTSSFQPRTSRKNNHLSSDRDRSRFRDIKEKEQSTFIRDRDRNQKSNVREKGREKREEREKGRERNNSEKDRDRYRERDKERSRTRDRGRSSSRDRDARKRKSRDSGATNSRSRVSSRQKRRN